MPLQKKSSADVTLGMIPAYYGILLAVTLGIFLVVWFVSRLWDGALPFTLSDLWIRSETSFDGIWAVWGIYVWGAVMPLLGGIILKFAKRPRLESPKRLFFGGLWISLNAGVFEELTYRWLRFSIALLALPALNWILLGFMSGQMGLLYWLYDSILLPVADFVTLGGLHDYLFYPGTWVIGAAIISANGTFREAHKENGVLSQVNAWFVGMVLFYVMFEYGLLTAIIVHVLYDVVVFSTIAFTSLWLPKYARTFQTPFRVHNSN